MVSDNNATNSYMTLPSVFPAPAPFLGEDPLATGLVRALVNLRRPWKCDP
jgi:hypothetical protein